MESPGFHVDGAFDLVVTLNEGVYRAHVNDRYRLVFSQFGLQLFSSDPIDLRRLCLVGLGLRRVLEAGGPDAGYRRAYNDRQKERADYYSPFSETHLVISYLGWKELQSYFTCHTPYLIWRMAYGHVFRANSKTP